MPQNIIGISLGTRTTGIVIVRGGHLIDWQVKSFKGKMNRQKLFMISGAVIKLLQEYDTTEIIMKIPDKAYSYTNVVSLKKHLEKVFASRKIPIHCYTLTDIKTSLGVSISNKEQLLDWGAKQFKELRRVYAIEQRNANPYYIKLFEALAAIFIHINST